MSFVCPWFDATRLVTGERTRRMCHGFSCERQQQFVGRLQRIGRQSRHSQNTETGRFRSGHLFPFISTEDHLSNCSASVSWEVRCEADRLFLGQGFGAIQALSRVDEITNIQCLIDAKYVTQGVEQRGELEYGSDGDLWSILFRLIDGHSGKTYVIKVKSHLEDDSPSAIQQNEIAFHHMLANSLADVVAEEAARRLLPDMSLEQT